MDTNSTPQTPPQAWLDALERGEADLAAGRVAPWHTICDVLEEVLAAMERGADVAEQKRLLLLLDSIDDDTYEDAPSPSRR